MIHFIWAEDENGLIGRDGALPWHLPNDLKFFKATTLHHTILMGRKTFEGMGKRLLPNRHTMIMTRDMSYVVAGATVVHSIDDVIRLSKQQDIFIVGGSEIYAAFSPYVDKLYQTKIHHTFDGDTHMASIDWTQFECIQETKGEVDEKNIFAHTFYTYTRKVSQA